jgi:hypothetical protein
MREERNLRAFEKRVLWRKIGPKRDEVTGEWRKLHNVVLNVVYGLPNIVWLIKSRRKIWTVNVACMWERRGVYRVLKETPEEKRPLRSPRRRWEDSIQMDLQEVGCRGMDWIDLAQDRDR